MVRMRAGSDPGAGPRTVLMIGVCILSLFDPSLAVKTRTMLPSGEILQVHKGFVPSARSGAGIVVFQGKVLVFGGLSAGGTLATAVLHSPQFPLSLPLE